MSVTYLPLKAWNTHWQLDGQRVRCRLCGVSQDLTDAGAFSHALGCKARSPKAQYPSQELAALLQQKIQAGCFEARRDSGRDAARPIPRAPGLISNF